jgi:hypothetical protein
MLYGGKHVRRQAGARQTKELGRGKKILDIETMVAGPAMDDLVAERVMGWVWVVPKPRAGLLHPGQRFLMDPEEFGNSWFAERYWDRARGDEPIDRAAMNTSPYSTDIAAAWAVVERLIEKKMFFDIRKNSARWYGGFDTIVEKANTPSLAICRAALRAASASLPPRTPRRRRTPA